MPDCSCSDNRDIINKIIKLKLQYFKHLYIQATCLRDPGVFATCHDPKIYPHTKGQGHSDLETVGELTRAQDVSSYQIWDF